MRPVRVIVVLLFLGLSLIEAQNSTVQSCACKCCWTADNDLGHTCGVAGAYAVDSCSQCDDNATDMCKALFPTVCAAADSIYSGEQECAGTDPDGDWAGDWVIDPCSACLLDVHGTPVGDCKPCCDSTQGCDCIYGTITISDLTSVDASQDKQLSIYATSTSGAATQLGNETGFVGTTASVAFTKDTYDLIKHGDHIQVLSQMNPACNVYATRNPAQTSMLKLALLLGGVGAAALICIVFCCCNPCKKKKKDEKLLGEGQEGQPQQTSSQVPAVGTVNYTGEKVINSSDI